MREQLIDRQALVKLVQYSPLAHFICTPSA